MNRCFIPLLKDHHSHPYLYAALAHGPDISGITDKAEALSRITESFTGEGIAVVTGWNDSCFGFETSELDPFPPLVVFNVSLHSLIINAGARDILVRSFPEVVDNYRDGAWLERNAAVVLNFLITIKPCDADRLRSYYDLLARQGVWHVEEMSLKDEAEIEVFRRASLLDRTRFWTDMKTFDVMTEASREGVRGIKLFADGALGARTAGLSERYLSGTEGILVYSDEELSELVSRAFIMGKAVAVHAIGDSAVDQAVRVLEHVMDRRGALPETRIEHCQFITKRAALKAKAMGVVLSMQPNFSLDSVCYRDRLSEEYCRRNNSFRMLLDDVGYVAGKDLILGSDGMPSGAQCALESALFPPFPGQKLTLDEFVAGYCMPDCRNGHIDIDVDYESGKVKAEVVLKENS